MIPRLPYTVGRSGSVSEYLLLRHLGHGAERAQAVHVDVRLVALHCIGVCAVIDQLPLVGFHVVEAHGLHFLVDGLVAVFLDALVDDVRQVAVYYLALIVRVVSSGSFLVPTFTAM